MAISEFKTFRYDDGFKGANMRSKIWAPILMLPIFLFACASKDGRDPKSEGLTLPLAVKQEPKDRAVYKATGTRFVIATQGQSATQVAKKIFDRGGNIIDAAIAASF